MDHLTNRIISFVGVNHHKTVVQVVWKSLAGGEVRFNTSDQTSHTNSQLVPDTEYSVQVVAGAGSGITGPGSETEPVAVRSLPVPGRVELLESWSDTLDLAWTPPPAPTRITSWRLLYWAEQVPPSTTGEREVGRDGERLNTQLSDLLPGTCYVIKVIAD